MARTNLREREESNGTPFFQASLECNGIGSSPRHGPVVWRHRLHRRRRHHSGYRSQRPHRLLPRISGRKENGFLALTVLTVGIGQHEQEMTSDLKSNILEQMDLLADQSLR